LSFSKPSSSRTYKTSSISSSKPSSVSEIISEISKMSEISSPTSSSISRSSSSPVSSIVSEIISEYGGSSITETPRSVPRPRITPFFLPLKPAKSKRRAKRKVTPEIEGLFPDFTSRAIGLAPTKVSGIEGAMREIKKLQTGFEIRRGARLPVSKNPSDIGFSGVSEKKLMRGFNIGRKANLKADIFGKTKKGKKSKRGMSDKELMGSVMA